MTMMDKINGAARATAQLMIDKESISYLEAGALYGIVAQGRFNQAVLQAMYNQAKDPDLRQLISQCINDQVVLTVEESEEALREGDAQVPRFHFQNRQLHNKPLDVPSDACLTDMEIAASLGTMAKASQMALLAALHQSYQLNVGMMLRKRLDEGLDWNLRLVTLMLNRGWLPHLAKVEH